MDFCYRQRIRSTCTTPYPIAIGSGEKYLYETDYAAPTNGGVEFRRIYRSGSMGSGLDANLTSKWREFGPYWRHNYQAGIFAGIGGSPDRAVVNRAGERLYFTRGGLAVDGRTIWTPNDGGRTDRLYSHPAPGGSTTQWEFYAADNTLDVFVGDTLTARATHDGRVQFVVGSGQVDTVTDNFGRQLRFERNPDGRLSAVVLPDLTRITFTHAQPNQWDASVVLAGSNTYFNLIGVTYPDQSARTYHYAESGHFDTNVPVRSAVTGITDESGARYSDYYYSTNGAALRSVIGGIVSYSVSGWSYTDPIGTTRSVRNTMVNGQQRVAGAYQPGGSGCTDAYSQITYDANGNVASRKDFDGHKTCYANDPARGLESKRVEGLSSSTDCTGALSTPPAPTAANPTRTISTQWHPDWQLEARRAEPKKITTWVYNGQPDPTSGGGAASCAPSTALLPDGKPIAVLCKRVEQATTDATGASGFSATVTGFPRTWTWTYNNFGQVLTADGPRTDVSDVTTYAYYTDTAADHTPGDLQSITDALGHTTHYTSYDKNGRPLTIVDPNGLTTALTYGPRGWLKTRQVGSELTTYDYDGVGLLKKVTAADMSWIGYDYDSARRLTDIYDNLGNRITYTLDNAGNRTKEEATDPTGTLVRTHARVYDALSRLQYLIQPE